MPGASLLPELEDMVQRGSAARRGEILRRIAALFLERASHFSEAHVQLFDDVLCRLIGEVDPEVRVELAHRLAPVDNAPRQLMHHLANDDDIAVARPVLKQSKQVDESELIRITQEKSQAHLLALAQRKGMGEPLSTVLAQRGDREVLRRLADNLEAHLSEAGFSALIGHSGQDGVLAIKIGLRPDIPGSLFRDLVIQAPHAVQQRLLASAKPMLQDEVRRALTKSLEPAAAEPVQRDYAAARSKILQLREQGRLDEAALLAFAWNRQYEELVVALACLCEVPVEVVDHVMMGDRADPILILCKAIGCAWTTVKAIMSAKPESHALSSLDIDTAFGNFERLSPTTAQRVMRFWQVQHWQRSPVEE
jgi:uncharacterized protein (DUF2336 family)